MRELIKTLNEASDAYYMDRDEIMSNYEWDALFDELARLEKETGIVLPNSPTHNTGRAETFAPGQTEPHEYPALSLAKSKDVSVLKKWAGDMDIWLSWKLDGITLVATYDDGRLVKLLTRGNGSVGTNVTHLAPYIYGLPMRIKNYGHMVVRGEATISYSDFERINDICSDGNRYANPRNLVAGSMSLDESRIDDMKDRHVRFTAFTLVYTEVEMRSWGDRMDYLMYLGFDVVESEKCDRVLLENTIERWTERVSQIDIPVDGLVIVYDDTEYAATGSVTGHHATNAGMAFKWQDEPVETILDHIEWSCSATCITPIAVFDPIEIEGSTVSRASLCNITEMKRLGIGLNRRTKLKVIKSNMIIPKVISAVTDGVYFGVPSKCPVCGAPTEITSGTLVKSETLHCTNPECPARRASIYERFVSKSGMDIDGISYETIKKFINCGLISDFVSFYHLKDHEAKLRTMDGFGDRSYENIIAAVEKSRKVNPINLITALSIPRIGTDAAKKIIHKYGFEGFIRKLEDGSGFEDISGFGPEKSRAITEWYADDTNRDIFKRLLAELDIREERREKSRKLDQLIFVITGELRTFKNRTELQKTIESNGGMVSNSVSSRTSFLINNDISSSSKKNEAAKEFGVPIITEEEFLNMIK